ncbi:MAG: FG-GAP repeat protein, partial [Opitutaceae bacterium]|nr:FG-GAP repeat protein [Opitutaceae bacterium]
NALIGAYGDGDKGFYTGSAYYYKGLDSVSGNSTGLDALNGKNATNQTVKLLASDGAESNFFGYSVSLSGDNALIGAYCDGDKGTGTGSAYYYKGLDSVNRNSTTETVKLLASDGTNGDYFGRSVSLSGDNALVGVDEDRDKGTASGSAYYYKGLDSVNGNLTDIETLNGKNATYETVKLLASDGAPYYHFGQSVSLSGDNALVTGTYLYGTHYDEEEGEVEDMGGAAYYYKKLDSVNGNLTDIETLNGKNATYETVKLLPSDSAGNSSFGTARNSASMDGDRFVIGARYARMNGVMVGKAYAGDIRAFTTLDADNGTGTALATDGLSFVSQTDWIIGATNANNTVTLTAGDTATVTADGKAVYIGQTAGADNNTLIIEGTLTATTVKVGAADTVGNTLRFTEAALDTLDVVGTVYLDAGNYLEFEGADLDVDDVLTLLNGTATVQVRGSSSEGWATLDAQNAATLLAKTGEVVYGDNGTWTRFTTFSAPAVPEPAGWTALAGLMLLVYALVLRRQRGKRV